MSREGWNEYWKTVVDTIQDGVMIVHPAPPSFKELPKQTEKGAFREDFYYRINVIPIKIPLSREKSEDIPYCLACVLRCCFRVSLAALPFSSVYDATLPCNTNRGMK
jgi:hypothetical protein